jgi:hypothetical protein
MKIFTTLTVFAAFAAAAFGAFQKTGDYIPLLKPNLIAEPAVFGAPAFKDRAAWEKLAEQPFFAKALKSAATVLDQPVAAPSDELYLEYSKNGNRTRYQNAFTALRNAAVNTALAYLMTADRKYLDKLETYLQVFLQLKSWSLPAHDKSLDVFKGKSQHIDLGSSRVTVDLAVIYFLLKDELKPETVRELKKQIYFRTLDPIRRMVDGKQKKDFWVESKTNWNAVCWANILSAALAIEEDNDARNDLVAKSLQYLDNSLQGFGPDGYCSEGVGYWNYGFGHNLRFAVTLFLATGGKINLMDLESMRRPAGYPERIVIVNDVYPAFADCSINVKVSDQALAFRDFLQNVPSKPLQALEPAGGLTEVFLALALPKLPGKIPAAQAEPELLSLFADSGIAIARPGRGGARLAAAFKAGSNHELHNHSDVGSYTITLDGTVMVFDPGSEVYTKRTFSPQRYESKLLNSYGHPVPLINGQLQKNGSGTDCPVVEQKSDAQSFFWRIDLAPAYQLKEVKKLERIFTFDRTGGGRVTVADLGEFHTDVTFETAILTPGKFTAQSATEGAFTYQGKTLKVAIEASAPFEFVPEEIKEEVAHKETITRIGIRFKEKVRHANVTVVFTP